MITELTNESLNVCIMELEMVCRGYISRAFGDHEQFYLDRVDTILPVIQALRDEKDRRLINNAI